LLLLHVLLDPSLPPIERARLLPELHGNAALTLGGAAYLSRAAAELEEAVHLHAAGGWNTERDAEEEEGVDDQKAKKVSPVARLLDLRGLKHRERDALAAVFSRWQRREGSGNDSNNNKNALSLKELWEARLRRRLGSRYDSRLEVADCDYHLRARDRTRFVVSPVDASSSSSPPPAASLLCREHFVHWRLTGVAHELRGRGDYAYPNPSLVSAAEGRLLPRGGGGGGRVGAAALVSASPFGGKEAGPTVVATGYWGDVSTGPFAALGGAPLWPWAGDEEDDDEAEHAAAAAAMAEAALAGEGPGLLARRSTVDAAELNVLVLLRRLYGGSCKGLEMFEAAHMAIKARGPTTEEDLAAAAAAAKADEGDGGATVAAEEKEDDEKTKEQALREAELWKQGLSNVRLALGLLGSADEAKGFAAAALRRAPGAAAASSSSSSSSFDVVSLGARQTTAALLRMATGTTGQLLLVEDAAGSVTLSEATARAFRERVRGAVAEAATGLSLVEGAEGGSAWWPLVAPGQMVFVRRG
jgi:hypothetical protein